MVIDTVNDVVIGDVGDEVVEHCGVAVRPFWWSTESLVALGLAPDSGGTETTAWPAVPPVPAPGDPGMRPDATGAGGSQGGTGTAAGTGEGSGSGDGRAAGDLGSEGGGGLSGGWIALIAVLAVVAVAALTGLAFMFGKGSRARAGWRRVPRRPAPRRR